MPPSDAVITYMISREEQMQGVITAIRNIDVTAAIIRGRVTHFATLLVNHFNRTYNGLNLQ